MLNLFRNLFRRRNHEYLKFAVDKETRQNIENLRIRSGAKDLSEVIRDSLACYDWYLTDNFTPYEEFRKKELGLGD